MIINYNFRKDIKNPEGDPDKLSFNLKLTHEQLWSKPLPNGAVLKLKAAKDKIEGYLNGELAFLFNPDSFVNTLSKSNRNKYSDLVKRWRIANKDIDNEINQYYSSGYTIGESMVFPTRGDDGSPKNTINIARGLSYSVQDRTDLTLECIRKHYLNEDNPLEKCLSNNNRFLSLYGSGIEGFVNFVKWFYLDDLVSEDFRTVIPFTSTLDFKHPQPVTEDEYLRYIKSVNSFVEKRNKRLLDNYPNVFEKLP